MELTAYGKHKFSRGDFSPSYYSFHDDDILYDSVYASPSGTALSAHGGFYEEQNSIVTRIKEMQRLELVTHFTSSMGASSEATTNITNTTFDNVNPANLKYFRSLGTSSPWDEHMPAWDIKCMETGMPFSGTYSYKALGIPTLTSSLQLEYSVSNGVFEDNNGDQVEIPIFTLEKEDKILIDIQEINTIFKSNGNFEVEVYKIKTDEQGSEDLVKVDFIGDNSKSSDIYYRRFRQIFERRRRTSWKLFSSYGSRVC
jgi:hypothetical protein